MGPLEKFDVLITGAARGIGKQIACDFTAKGHRAQTPSRLILDLSDINSIKNFLLGNGDHPIDILILNAGQNYPQSLEEMEIRNWDETQMVNATSSLLLIQHYAPKMAARGYGRIVAISSAYASRARFGRSAYSASKATLEAIVRSVAIEFADKGVIANCGAYVGEIIEYARNLDFEVNSIFAFEPDPSNYLKLTQNLNTSGLAGTSLAIPMGVGDATALLRFSADGNLSAAISDVGDTFVQITSIDECIVSRDINYVKMDIEGAEQKALIGMKNMLINLRPNPAISAYHKPNDLWSLGLWLNKLNLGYKFSIRCYGHQCFDTVLYGYQVDKEHK
jgi:3-oxoacyl-[acyl-carrier protein] reductase